METRNERLRCVSFPIMLFLDESEVVTKHQEESRNTRLKDPRPRFLILS